MPEFTTTVRVTAPDKAAAERLLDELLDVEFDATLKVDYDELRRHLPNTHLTDRWAMTFGIELMEMIFAEYAYVRIQDNDEACTFMRIENAVAALASSNVQRIIPVTSNGYDYGFVEIVWCNDEDEIVSDYALKIEHIVKECIARAECTVKQVAP